MSRNAVIQNSAWHTQRPSREKVTDSRIRLKSFDFLILSECNSPFSPQTHSLESWQTGFSTRTRHVCSTDSTCSVSEGGSGGVFLFGSDFSLHPCSNLLENTVSQDPSLDNCITLQSSIIIPLSLFLWTTTW